MGVTVGPQICILYDANGVAMAVENGVAVPANTRALLVAGQTAGGDAVFMKVGATGVLHVEVDGGTVPLPTGASTSANQTNGNQKTQIVDASGNVMPSQDTAARAAFTKLTDGTNTMAVTAASAAKVDGSAVTQPISAASLPLPTGAAQEHVTAGSPNSTRLSDGTSFYDAAKTGQLPTALTGSGNLKAAIVEFTAAIPTGSNTIGKVDQGVANTAANRWPIYPTDGTNNMPMLDAAARAGFFKLTDGTNVHPTADVAARAAFTKVTDGTNTMPTGDAIARAIYHLITDGTNGPVAVKAASTAPVAADKALVTVLSPNQPAIPVSVSAPAGTTPGFSFGDVALSSIVSNTAVRRTTYTEQSSNAQRSLVSANANDSSAGTGARTVRITYYTSTLTGPFTETVTMNGTTPVNTVATDICYIEKLEVLTVGSGGTNAGIISLKAATAGGGATIWTIGAGDLQTYGAHHYIATGKTCNVTSMSVTVNGGSAIFFLRSTPLTANAADRQISDYVRAATQSGTISRNFGTNITITGPGRISAYVNTEANTSLVYRAAFDYYDA